MSQGQGQSSPVGGLQWREVGRAVVLLIVVVVVVLAVVVVVVIMLRV